MPTSQWLPGSAARTTRRMYSVEPTKSEAWQTSKAWALGAALGVFVAAAFTLRAIQVSFFGKDDRDAAASVDHGHHHYDPITVPEKAGAFLLIAASLVVGLKPDLLFDWITPALQSPEFQAVLKGGTP